MSLENVELDPHTQLRSLYRALLLDQECFDEFKYLLSLYVVPPDAEEESAEAADVRSKLNRRIREWVGDRFEGLSASQMLQWRAIVIEERLNVAISPWRESNAY